jgi:hypothetical protein
MKPFPAPQAIRADGTALLCKEVLYSVSSGNRKPPFAAASLS